MKTETSDRKSLEKIHEAAMRSPRDFAMAVHLHYCDFDRAERTSREMMYLHIGMLIGKIMRILPKGGNSQDENLNP
jgi:hypothetical protein